MFFAPRECGKSFLSIDLALSIAHGVPWLGVAPDTERESGSALFLLAEGQSGFPRRLAAWLVAHRLLSESFTARELADALDGRAAIVTEPPRLDDPNFSEILTGEIHRRAVRIVVMDTLSGLLGLSGLNPDQNKDAGLVMTVLNRIAATTGATILLIHHVGHKDTKRPVGAVGWGNHSEP